jgi:hypothetical protein
MKNLTLLFSFLITLQLSFAQNDIQTRNTIADIDGLNTHGAWVQAKTNKTIILGSVYLFPNWIGQYKVMAKNGVTTNLYNLNYNIKEQTIESSISNDSVFQYDIDKIDYVEFSKNKYKVFEDQEMKGLYLEIINNNKLKVYKGYSITVVTGSINPMTQEKISEDTYEQNTQYYFYNEGKYEKFKPSKKSILKLLNDKSTEIKEYLSKHSISFSNDQDLKDLFNYYSTI